MVPIVQIIESFGVKGRGKKLFFVDVGCCPDFFYFFLNNECHVAVRNAEVLVHEHPVVIFRVKPVAILKA